MVWSAEGLPAQPEGLAARRNAALQKTACEAQTAPGFAQLQEAREITLLPALSPPPGGLFSVMHGLRGQAPHAVLRLEWWLDEVVTPVSWAAVLRSVQPLFVHAVVTAPDQPTGMWGAQVERLIKEGVPVAAVILLRRDILDMPESVRALCLDLERAGVRPYYLVDAAWLSARERVPRKQALEIVRSLRGWISGLAVPQLLEERCDGSREPLIPDAIEHLDQTGLDVRNYEGRRLRYLNPSREPA
jgi:hypothetical protein